MRLIESQEKCQDITKCLQRVRGGPECSQWAASTRAWATGEEVEGSGGHISGARCLTAQQCCHWGSSSGAASQLPSPSSLLLCRMGL